MYIYSSYTDKGEDFHSDLFAEGTEVTFDTLSEASIDAYVGTGTCLYVSDALTRTPCGDMSHAWGPRARMKAMRTHTRKRAHSHYFM